MTQPEPVARSCGGRGKPYPSNYKQRSLPIQLWPRARASVVEVMMGACTAPGRALPSFDQLIC